MSTKRPRSSGTASAGVAHIAKVTSLCNCAFNPIGQENDVGNDGIIEFFVNEAATGCCVATQIKSGASYIRNGKFVLPGDQKHFEYWRKHSLPFCGFVYDPATDLARWVDITAHVNDHPTQFTIPVPDENIFDRANFDKFRDRCLSYRSQFSDAASFGRALADFSHLEDLRRCENGIRALFSFHRSRIETWYYVTSVLNNFRNHPLLQLLTATLAHVPGHGDIFWVPGQNTIPESVCKEAEILLRKMLSRDSVVALLGAIGDEGGFERGSIGQSVAPIIDLVPNRRAILESIVLDATLPSNVRYWALLRQILHEQYRDRDHCIALTEKARSHFTDRGHQECICGLLETLRTPGKFV